MGEFPNEFTLPVDVPIWSPASSGLLQEFDDSGSRVKVGGANTIQCHHEAGVSRVLTHAGAVIVDNEVVVVHDPFGLHRVWTLCKPEMPTPSELNLWSLAEVAAV